MHIIMGDQITEELLSKYIVLELDNFHITSKDRYLSAYCLVENVPLAELPQADQFQDLHAQTIKNFRQGNWQFCEHALEHLIGRWNGEVDSFYETLRLRVLELRDQGLDRSSWDPTIKI